MSEYSGPIKLRLSVAQLRELIENAPAECWIMFRGTDANGMWIWVDITPYES